MDPLQTLLGIKTTHLIAGVAGGIVKAFLAGGGWLAAISAVVIGFLVGLTAMLICEGVTKAVRGWSNSPKLPPSH